jgi:hypothetical protein
LVLVKLLAACYYVPNETLLSKSMLDIKLRMITYQKGNPAAAAALYLMPSVDPNHSEILVQQLSRFTNA